MKASTSTNTASAPTIIDRFAAPVTTGAAQDVPPADDLRPVRQRTGFFLKVFPGRGRGPGAMTEASRRNARAQRLGHAAIRLQHDNPGSLRPPFVSSERVEHLTNHERHPGPVPGPPSGFRQGSILSAGPAARWTRNKSGVTFGRPPRNELNTDPLVRAEILRFDGTRRPRTPLLSIAHRHVL
jgi:hypothetical protein